MTDTMGRPTPKRDRIVDEIEKTEGAWFATRDIVARIETTNATVVNTIHWLAARGRPVESRGIGRAKQWRVKLPQREETHHAEIPGSRNTD